MPITSSKHPVFELQSWVSLTAVSTEAEGISEITINGQFLASTCQGSNEQRQFTSINALNGYKISLSLSLSFPLPLSLPPDTLTLNAHTVSQQRLHYSTHNNEKIYHVRLEEVSPIVCHFTTLFSIQGPPKTQTEKNTSTHRRSVFPNTNLISFMQTQTAAQNINSTHISTDVSSMVTCDQQYNTVLVGA